MDCSSAASLEVRSAGRLRGEHVRVVDHSASERRIGRVGPGAGCGQGEEQDEGGGQPGRGRARRLATAHRFGAVTVVLVALDPGRPAPGAGAPGPEAAGGATLAPAGGMLNCTLGALCDSAEAEKNCASL